MAGRDGAAPAEDVVDGEVRREAGQVVDEGRPAVRGADGATQEEGSRQRDDEPGNGEHYDDHALFLTRTPVRSPALGRANADEASGRSLVVFGWMCTCGAGGAGRVRRGAWEALRARC